MSERRETVLRCPTCDKPAPPDGPDRPFCCKRCRMVDLGAWLLGHYRIPAEEGDDMDVVEWSPPDDDDGGGTEGP